jgi:anti-sigma factor RsiW
MHQPIREGLEDYLNGSGDREISQDFAAHLASCRACANQLDLIREQAGLLRVLRPVEDAEPRPGFYARVMDRLENQVDSSIWSIFLRPSFGRRIAIASAALVLLMGTYLVSTEPGERGVSTNPVVSTSRYVDESVPPGDSLQQQRDAVLVNLASYPE